MQEKKINKMVFKNDTELKLYLNNMVNTGNAAVLSGFLTALFPGAEITIAGAGWHVRGIREEK